MGTALDGPRLAQGQAEGLKAQGEGPKARGLQGRDGTRYGTMRKPMRKSESGPFFQVFENTRERVGLRRRERERVSA